MSSGFRVCVQDELREAISPRQSGLVASSHLSVSGLSGSVHMLIKLKETEVAGGLIPLPNDRGPFMGDMFVTDRDGNRHEMTVICHSDDMLVDMGEDPCRVCVVRTDPDLGFSRCFKEPLVAEAYAVILEGLRHVTELQLEDLGFVEDRRDMESPGMNDQEMLGAE